MDINLLLAAEQASLLRARFASAAAIRESHLATAAEAGRLLQLSTYPHAILPPQLAS